MPQRRFFSTVSTWWKDGRLFQCSQKCQRFLEAIMCFTNVLSKHRLDVSSLYNALQALPVRSDVPALHHTICWDSSTPGDIWQYGQTYSLPDPRGHLAVRSDVQALHHTICWSSPTPGDIWHRQYGQTYKHYITPSIEPPRPPGTSGIASKVRRTSTTPHHLLSLPDPRGHLALSNIMKFIVL